MIAGNMIGVCEALLYGYRAGLDLETVMQIDRLGRRRRVVPFQPGPADHREQFRPRLLRRALHQGHGHRPGGSETHGLVLPGLALVHQLYLSVAAQGHSRNGTQALHLALAAMSGIDWPRRGPVSKQVGPLGGTP